MPQEDKKGLIGPQVRRAVTMRGTNARPEPTSLRPRSSADADSGRTQKPDVSGHADERDGGEPTVVMTSSSSVAEASSSESASAGTAPAGGPAGEPAEKSAEKPAAGKSAEKPAEKSAEEPAEKSAEKPVGRPAGRAAGRPAGGVAGESVKADGEPARTSASTRKKVEENSDAAVGSLIATGSGSPPGASRGDTGTGGDEPPSGRPTKALLAAAGIGGALLIAVPLLIIGAHREDETKPAAVAEQKSDRVLPPDDGRSRPGVYAPKSPEAEKKKAKEESPKKEEKAEEETAPPPPPPSDSAKEADEVKKEDDDKKKPRKKRKELAVFRAASANYANKKHVLLRNLESNLCADIPNFGKGKPDGPVNQFHCRDTDKDNQIWDFEVKYKGDGPRSTDLFQIRNRKDGLCMDLPNFGGQPRGTRVSEYHCDGTKQDNQLWWLEPRGKSTFWIHNYASNHQCLAVVHGPNVKPVDARLNIQPCQNGDGFRWKLR
ncbi:RICIN domain-containing protein [Streptomyces albus]|uniref:RICIN domain-containing protein n=1 Tax=Streptomyces sp. PHES57 TaxID=2872626 RepID=UPI001CEC6018|nr:RICIN domain-containing protein [Streptomyces sp. PHES57]